MKQTGMVEQERRQFLNDWHSRAWGKLIHIWEAEEVADDEF